MWIDRFLARLSPELRKQRERNAQLNNELELAQNDLRHERVFLMSDRDFYKHRLMHSYSLLRAMHDPRFRDRDGKYLAHTQDIEDQVHSHVRMLEVLLFTDKKE